MNAGSFSSTVKCKIVGSRGKFIFHNEEKIFLKAIRVGKSAFDLNLLKETNANTVWLEDPTPERVDLFLSLGFYVVLDLGFREVLQARFVGDFAAEKRWQSQVLESLEHCAVLPKVVAVDLGAGHSSGHQKLLGRSCWLRMLRKALRGIRKTRGDKLLPCTFAVYREGSQFKFGHDFAITDIGETFHQIFDLPIDFASFEFADEDLTDLRNSLARMQITCYDLPLIAHIRPSDSESLSLSRQAHTLDGQIRLGFSAGCAGVVIGSWQDGRTKCGLIDSAGNPKPALKAAAMAFSQSPFSPIQPWPMISIVICAYNSEETLDECLAGCAVLDYPDFEVITVVDRSPDQTEAIANGWAQKSGYKVIIQESNRGLSAARNAGAQHATGEIIAFLDADAFPERDWLRFLALKFLHTKYAVVGGPNLNPLHASEISDCVDKAPGNPGLVMLDSEACDHVAGCNLAVRREFFNTIGGFTDSYRGGGDDVTFCWRVICQGGALGFAPGAMVWHYRRRTIRQFLKQQRVYGRGESALERDWPERFNSLGHQVAPERLPGWKRSQPAPVGGMYQPYSSGANFLLTIGKMPEFFLINLVLFGLAGLTAFWREFSIFIWLCGLGLALWVAPAMIEAKRAPLRRPMLRLRMITGFLFMAQPLARAYGRWGTGMTPWRNRLRPTVPSANSSGFIRLFLSRPLIFPLKKQFETRDFQKTRRLEEEQIEAVTAQLRFNLVPFSRGDSNQSWHLQIEGGVFAGARGSVSLDPPSAWRFWPFVSFIAKGLLLACHC